MIKRPDAQMKTKVILSNKTHVITVFRIRQMLDETLKRKIRFPPTKLSSNIIKRCLMKMLDSLLRQALREA